MLYCGNEEFKPEKYKDYRNRTVNKNLNRFDHQLSGIRQSSLRPEDKAKLLVEMANMLTEELNKFHPVK